MIPRYMFVGFYITTPFYNLTVSIHKEKSLLSHADVGIIHLYPSISLKINLLLRLNQLCCYNTCFVVIDSNYT